ncbi:Mu transposase C-terminal domain-containing protein [Nonomuraea basaltis]|uniref:Mu transposase C-terminal domain-containing protein n=1 Tax=Nonomuraea basaltis TaxID=2495887 RepID=UPI00110C4DD6|nr:Mu transposase C-terminal domain-containing protein [Nonomuraea basaltis]TMR90658.1 DDE-type integrase/transposase/recombinase [Nonomuraea basaltis]
MDGGQAQIIERGVLTAPDEAWDVAVRQAEVIGPLADQPRLGSAAADAAAAQLGISQRQVYVLLARWRAGEGVVSDLLPRRSSGGRGRRRLPAAVEAVLHEVIEARYLTRQRRSVAAVYREVVRRCRVSGLPVPARSTLERRIEALDPAAAATAREGADGARRLRSAGGDPPSIEGLLQQVQIDHTPGDLEVVDERHRLPIGRPYVTAAIDVASRCVVGLVVTLEAPSALSAGLCLAHTVCDKRSWLERLGVEAVAWPMSGKPHEIHVDNATEFRSEALRRGCAQHGITLAYRPKGMPHFGGVIERLIGTMMQMVHELPGTTFSNPAERGSYDSQAMAVVTVAELNRWLALAVAAYHGQVHATLGQTPAGRWAEGVAAGGRPATVASETAFLVDFLPVIRRTLRRTGFTIDHVRYYSDALKPWIARRDNLEKFVLRRDPRDLSRIWVLDPDGHAYLPVPYRTLSRPPISVWEQRAAIARLREQGRAQVDENALFAMVVQMRQITNDAAAKTRRARREVERRSATPAPQAAGPLSPPPVEGCADGEPVRPFEVIEQW